MSAQPLAHSTEPTELASTLPPEVYQQAVNQAELAISITDPQARILYANECFLRVTGYSLDDIVGQNQSLLSNRSTPSTVYDEMWTALSARRPWSGKLLNKKKSGELYLAELLVTPVLNPAGELTHFLGMHRDVTELHRLEKTVRNQKHLIESVIDAAPMAFALLDPTGRIVLDNQEYKKLVTDMQVREPAHHLLDLLRPGWRETLLGDAERCEFSSRETRMDRTAGRARWLSVSASCIDIHSDCADSYFCAGGQPGLLLVISDITNLREEQERARGAALKASLAEEERTAAIREGLSAAVFRLEEPLNVMASAISVLQRRDPASAEMLRHALEHSREHVESLRQVIPQSPQEMVISVNLNEILRDVLEICTPRLLNAGITVDWQPSPILPPLHGRPLQLRMLFKALMENAIEAMNIKGWLRRELHISSQVVDDCIRISLLDSGPGIPEEWRHKAFEPFFTAKSGVGKHIGTGLSRAQQVVADHGGIIDLEESPSGGCAAIVEFRIDGDPI
jgi:nitrogen fixation regulatory protein